MISKRFKSIINSMKTLLLKLKNIIQKPINKEEVDTSAKDNTSQVNKEEMKKFLDEMGEKYEKTFKLLAKEDF